MRFRKTPSFVVAKILISRDLRIVFRISDGMGTNYKDEPISLRK